MSASVGELVFRNLYHGLLSNEKFLDSEGNWGMADWSIIGRIGS